MVHRRQLRVAALRGNAGGCRQREYREVILGGHLELGAVRENVSDRRQLRVAELPHAREGEQGCNRHPPGMVADLHVTGVNGRV